MSERTILDRAEEFWDSDGSDDASGLVWVSDNGCGECIVRDVASSKFYRIRYDLFKGIEDADIIEVRPYKVIVTRYR